MGDVVTSLVLDKYGARPELRSNPAEVFIPTFDETCRAEALLLASELRSNGLRVEWYPEVSRMSKQFKYADRQGIPLAAIIGPDEIKSSQVAIKDLRSGEQVTVSREEILPRILEKLELETDS